MPKVFLKSLSMFYFVVLVLYVAIETINDQEFFGFYLKLLPKDFYLFLL